MIQDVRGERKEGLAFDQFSETFNPNCNCVPNFHSEDRGFLATSKTDDVSPLACITLLVIISFLQNHIPLRPQVLEVGLK